MKLAAVIARSAATKQSRGRRAPYAPLDCFPLAALGVAMTRSAERNTSFAVMAGLVPDKPGHDVRQPRPVDPR